MEKYLIQGGRRLKGTVAVSGNKNEALPALVACLLTREPVVLRNVPSISDVRMMMEILIKLGAVIKKIAPNSYEITCRDLNSEPDRELCRELRASILLAGSLISRFDQVSLPPPGGDVIGRRRLDVHFSGLQELGVQVQTFPDHYLFRKTDLKGTFIFMEEQSVTATENILMASVKAQGQTTIQNAACEPHVVGLARMLRCMGARLTGVGTNVLQIEGAANLSGCEHEIGPDYLEVTGYIVLAAMTHSEITIRNVCHEDLLPIRPVFFKLGIEYVQGENEIIIPADQKMEILSDLADVLKIDDAPWPGFPSDLMSILIVAATQVKGTILFFEKMYDGRMFFIDHLIRMGARIVLCDPHRAVVVGPSPLFGSIIQSPDIRAGMALVIAALCGQGESIIYNIRQIDRGYERLEEKLQQLGAGIQRIIE